MLEPLLAMLRVLSLVAESPSAAMASVATRVEVSTDAVACKLRSVCRAGTPISISVAQESGEGGWKPPPLFSRYGYGFYREFGRSGRQAGAAVSYRHCILDDA